MFGEVKSIKEISVDFKYESGYKVYKVISIVLVVALYPLTAVNKCENISLTRPVLYNTLISDIDTELAVTKGYTTMTKLEKVPGFQEIYFKRDILILLKTELRKAMKRAKESKNNSEAIIGGTTKKLHGTRPKYMAKTQK